MARVPFKFAGSVAAMATTMVLTAGPAIAQVPNPAPDASMPGARLVGQVLGWLKFGALAAAVAGILGGGIAAGVGHFGGHMGASSAARKWILGGIGAAVLAGMAWTITDQVYASAG